MVKNVYKFKAVIKDDNDNETTKYFKNTKEITQQLNIPRSSIFCMINPDKRNIEKYRHIKIERCSEPVFITVARIL
jgi:hypothetical protein